MVKIRLSENAVTVWRIRFTALGMVCAFIIGGIFVFSRFLGIFFTLIFSVFYAVIMVFYLPMLYKECYFVITDKYILISKGIIFKREIKVIKESIQYIEEIQTPEQRFFKTYTVRIFTAGSFVLLEQITKKHLDKLTDKLK